MIVNFHKFEEIGSFSSIHHVTFEENKNWDLSVLHFICKFKQNLDHSGIYQLSSNLIQRADGNIHRTLLYVYLEKGTNFVDITPKQSYKYKLRLHDISNAEFSKTRGFTEAYTLVFWTVHNSKLQLTSSI